MNIFGPKKRQEESVEKSSFNREDSTGRGNEAYRAFTKDKRMRTTSEQQSPNNDYSANREKETEYRRKSYNPNFSSENKFKGGGRYEGEKRFRNQEYRPNENRYGSRNYEGRNQYNKRYENSPAEGEADGNTTYSKYHASYGGAQHSNRNYQKRNGYRPRINQNHEEGENNFNRYESRERHEGRPARYNKFENNSYKGKRTYDKGSKPTYNAENYPKYPAPKIEEEIRLNKYISMSGICSRREADDYITEGRITVNDVVVTEMGVKIKQGDVVKFDGRVIENEKKVYIVMNKPKGYVTSLEDPHSDKTVMDLLKNACKERIYPVGRLDKNSLGVLLFTNDGDLAKRLTHPSHEKKKIYQVSLNKALTKADMEQIVAGITLEDGEIHADEVSYIGDKKSEVGIEIHSGRNRIVRRIFDHLGYKVNKLDRVYFAGLTKLKLKRGAWRFLSPREVAMLKSGSYE